MIAFKPRAIWYDKICFNNYFAEGDIAVVESFGVVRVDSGTLQILDSSALTNFICVLLGSQNCLICSCVTIWGVAFASANDIPKILAMIAIINPMMMTMIIIIRKLLSLL